MSLANLEREDKSAWTRAALSRRTWIRGVAGRPWLCGRFIQGGLFTLPWITQRQWRRASTIRPSSCYPAVIVEAVRNNSEDDGCSTLRRDIISGKTIRSVPAGTKLPCLSPGFIRGSIIKALFLRWDRLWLVKIGNNGRTWRSSSIRFCWRLRNIKCDCFSVRMQASIKISWALRGYVLFLKKNSQHKNKVVRDKTNISIIGRIECWLRLVPCMLLFRRQGTNPHPAATHRMFCERLDSQYSPLPCFKTTVSNTRSLTSDQRLECIKRCEWQCQQRDI